MITLYSTNCPKCNVLKQKLQSLNIDFEISNNIDELIELGFMEAPILKVNDQYLNFSKAVNWIKEQK
jgi:glutaredoxin-related protein